MEINTSFSRFAPHFKLTTGFVKEGRISSSPSLNILDTLSLILHLFYNITQTPKTYPW